MVTGFENIIGVNPWTALFTFLNMILTFLLLKKFFFGPVKKMIDDRQKEIDDQYAAAEAEKKKADELAADYQQKLSSAMQEREQIVQKAVLDAQRRSGEIVQSARTEAAAIKERAAADIALERKKAVNEMKDELSGLAVEIAAKVTEKEISVRDHEALIAGFIDSLGENNK